MSLSSARAESTNIEDSMNMVPRLPRTPDARCHDKGIGDMILAEVQLEDPSNGYAPMYKCHRPAGAVLVDLPEPVDSSCAWTVSLVWSSYCFF